MDKVHSQQNRGHAVCSQRLLDVDTYLTEKKGFVSTNLFLLFVLLLLLLAVVL